MSESCYDKTKSQWERHFKEIGDLFGDAEEVKAREAESEKMQCDLLKAKQNDEARIVKLAEIERQRVEHIEYEIRRVSGELEKEKSKKSAVNEAKRDAEEHGLLIRAQCKDCGEAAWVPQILQDGLCRSVCDNCGSSITADRDQTLAINLGLMPGSCRKCDDEDWTFVSLSKNRRAAQWKCNYCNRLQMAKLIEAVASSHRDAIKSSVRREVWRRDQGRCVQCASQENLEYDHIIPVSKGGANTTRNIQLLCEPCNRSKSAKIQ